MKRRTQKIAVALAILGILGQCLYPPWTIALNCLIPTARVSTVWVNGVYGPLFAPPGQQWLEQNGESCIRDGKWSHFRANALIDWSRLSIGILGWLALVSLVPVPLWLFGRQTSKTPEEKRP